MGEPNSATQANDSPSSAVLAGAKCPRTPISRCRGNSGVACGGQLTPARRLCPSGSRLTTVCDANLAPPGFSMLAGSLDHPTTRLATISRARGWGNCQHCGVTAPPRVKKGPALLDGPLFIRAFAYRPTAFATLMRPYPYTASLPFGPRSSTELISAWRTCAGLFLPCFSTSLATTPETCAVACDVPT